MNASFTKHLGLLRMDGSLRPLAIMLLFLAGISGTLFGNNAEAFPPAKDLTLIGIMKVGKNPYAAFKEKALGWTGLNETVGDYTVVEFRPNAVVLKRAGLDTRYLCRLEEAKAEVAGKGVVGPPRYSPAWINSKANPLVNTAPSLPLDIAKNWRSLSKEEIESLLRYFEGYGWKLSYAEVGGGSLMFAWDNIYEAERAAVVAKKTAAFVATLRPEQKAIWDELRKTSPLKATNGQLSEEQKAIHEYRIGRSNEFKASLTKEQAAVSAGRSDYTTADWSTTPIN
jgi:hypothetical protein